MTEQLKTRPTETAPSGPSRRVIWVLAALVAVVFAGIAVWFVVADDDGLPTVTFDGQSATYDGPNTFDAGEVTFKFDASAYEPGVAFVVLEITDDNITYEDLEASADEYPASGSGGFPPFAGAFEVTAAVNDDLVVEDTFVLEAGTRYALTANTAPGDTDRVHPAAIIEAE